MSLNKTYPIHKLNDIGQLKNFICQLGHYVLINDVGLFELIQGYYADNGVTRINAKQMGKNYFFFKVLAASSSSASKVFAWKGNPDTSNILLNSFKESISVNFDAAAFSFDFQKATNWSPNTIVLISGEKMDGSEGVTYHYEINNNVVSVRCHQLEVLQWANILGLNIEIKEY